MNCDAQVLSCSSTRWSTAKNKKTPEWFRILLPKVQNDFERLHLLLGNVKLVQRWPFSDIQWKLWELHPHHHTVFSTAPQRLRQLPATKKSPYSKMYHEASNPPHIHLKLIHEVLYMSRLGVQGLCGEHGYVITLCSVDSSRKPVKFPPLGWTAFDAAEYRLLFLSSGWFNSLWTFWTHLHGPYIKYRMFLTGEHLG